MGRRGKVRLENLERLVAAADANARRLEARDATLARLFSDAELVWGLWADDRQPGGIAAMLLKGRGRAPRSPATAIRCREAAEAEALRRTFGDRRGEAR